MPPMFVVALYGRSLILASVGAHLERRTGIHVVTVEEDGLETALKTLAPDVLMVDLHSIDVASALPVLDAHPELLLVGLEPSGARLVVLSGRHARTMTTEELMGLIARLAEQTPAAASAAGRS